MRMWLFSLLLLGGCWDEVVHDRDCPDSGEPAPSDTATGSDGDSDSDTDSDTDTDIDADTDTEAEIDTDDEWDTETTTYTDVAVIHGHAGLFAPGVHPGIEVKAFSVTTDEMVASMVTDSSEQYELIVPHGTYNVHGNWLGFYWAMEPAPPLEAGMSVTINLLLEGL